MLSQLILEYLDIHFSRKTRKPEVSGAKMAELDVAVWTLSFPCLLEWAEFGFL
jgi:hypothetical protein